jgi:hypothetical protein
LHFNLCATRSLFEKDKLLFAFLLAARIMMGQQELEAAHYNFLLTGKHTSQELQHVFNRMHAI